MEAKWPKLLKLTSALPVVSLMHNIAKAGLCTYIIA